MKMKFYTPVYGNVEGFGAASFGFAGQEDVFAITVMRIVYYISLIQY